MCLVDLLVVVFVVCVMGFGYINFEVDCDGIVCSVVLFESDGCVCWL